jgi:hypothetical protein
MLDPDKKSEMDTLREVLENTRKAAYINGRMSRLELVRAMHRICAAGSLFAAQDIARQALYADGAATDGAPL